MEEQLIEHTIVIDKYATAVLQIPKRMTPVEFKGLMTKANKLFNISSDDLMPKLDTTSTVVNATPVKRKVGRPKGSTSSNGTSSNGHRKRKSTVVWSDQMKEDLVRFDKQGLESKVIFERLTERHSTAGLTRQKVEAMRWYLRNKR